MGSPHSWRSPCSFPHAPRWIPTRSATGSKALRSACLPFPHPPEPARERDPRAPPDRHQQPARRPQPVPRHLPHRPVPPLRRVRPLRPEPRHRPHQRDQPRRKMAIARASSPRSSCSWWGWSRAVSHRRLRARSRRRVPPRNRPRPPSRPRSHRSPRTQRRSRPPPDRPPTPPNRPSRARLPRGRGWGHTRVGLARDHRVDRRRTRSAVRPAPPTAGVAGADAVTIGRIPASAARRTGTTSRASASPTRQRPRLT